MLRYMSLRFGEWKSSNGRNCVLKVISLYLPSRNQPAQTPLLRAEVGREKVMFKSILFPAWEKYTNVHCQAVVGECHRVLLSGTA